MLSPQKRSRKQEVRVAQELGGRRQPASGAFWNRKGDVKTDTFLVECKRTEKKGFRLSADLWEAIRRKAHEAQRQPAMQIDLQNGQVRLIVLDYDDFLSLI